ncbi:MAG TPA: alanine racemase [Gammaproteobacteria bacterium]|nr:alanine racemase [Gammaproteobacteria bacterium]
MRGVPRALVDAAALRHNLARVRRAAPGSAVLAAVKADGYGHGLLRVAHTLSGRVEGFAVARVDEAERLRAAGIVDRIVVLEGAAEPRQVARARTLEVELVVHDRTQLELLEQAASGGPLRVWIKIDSGMHRLGFAPAEVGTVYARLRSLETVVAPIPLLTHLACADIPDRACTDGQIECFMRACEGLDGPRSLANSAGVLGFPGSHADCVRPGIMLYGVSPFEGRHGEQEGLRPVMEFVSELISVKPLQRGGRVGYGGRWAAPVDTRIGVVAAGYGDGYPRHVPDGTPILVNGRRVPLVGCVSMDMLTVDLGPEGDERVGDPVTLWGGGLPVEEIARAAGTIAYDLLCGLGTRRVMVEERGAVETSAVPQAARSRQG